MAAAKSTSGSAKSGNRPLKILIAHGVNLDLLGTREPDIYGSATADDINTLLQQKLSELCQLAGETRPVELHFFQSNDEAAFLQKLSDGWQGCVINAGAWTHTSLAIADRLRGLQLPYVEVHLSNLARREPFRHRSYLAAHALGTVHGLGADSYISGLYGLLRFLVQR